LRDEHVAEKQLRRRAATLGKLHTSTARRSPSIPKSSGSGSPTRLAARPAARIPPVPSGSAPRGPTAAPLPPRALPADIEACKPERFRWRSRNPFPPSSARPASPSLAAGWTSFPSPVPRAET
jgi:hypothetical protein